MPAVAALAALAVAHAGLAGAQPQPNRFDTGLQVASAVSDQFGGTDVGIGGRLSWHPVGPLGIESEITLYPRNLPHGRAISRGRVEGLFGVTVGPRLARLRPFAKVRTGFLNIRAAPEPVACVAIFPPPLSCELAAGRTLLAFDVGGGVDLFVGRTVSVRIEAGDRLLKYPGPVLADDGTQRNDGFVGHDFRFAAGAGVRF
jgi:hypothetical protein